VVDLKEIFKETINVIKNSVNKPAPSFNIAEPKTDVVQTTDEDSRELSSQLFHEGNLYFQQENFDEAGKKYIEILKINSSDTLTRVTAYNNLAAISLKTDRIEEAQNRLNIAEGLLKQISLDKNAQCFEFHLNLGRVLAKRAFCLHRSRAQPSVVVKKYEDALKVLRDVHSNSFDLQIEIAEILLSIVVIKLQEGKRENVKTTLEEAQAIVEGLDRSSEERFISIYVDIRRLLASFFQEENQYFLVEKNYLEAEAMLIKSSLPRLIQKKFEIDRDLGDLYFKTKRYQEAERRYSSALEYVGTASSAYGLRAQLRYKQILCCAALEKDDEVEKKALEFSQYSIENKDWSNKNVQTLGDVCLLKALACKKLGKMDASKNACQNALVYYSKAFVQIPRILPSYQLAFKLKYELESQRVSSAQIGALRQNFEKALANPIDDSALARALENYARALFQENKWDEAQEACVWTLGIFELVDRRNSNAIARVNKILTRSDALRFCRNALAVNYAQDKEDKEFEEAALHIYARLNQERSSEEITTEYFQRVSQCVKDKKTETARRYCELAIDSYERTNLEFQKKYANTIAQYYLAIGEYQRQNNLHQDAQDAFGKFFALYERQKEKLDFEPTYLKKIMSAYFFIAKRTPSQENERKASEFFDSLSEEIQTQFLKDAASTGRALADRLYDAQQYDEALIQYKRALELFNKLEQFAPNDLQKKEKASILNVIGTLYFRGKKLQEAKPSYKSAWNISKTLLAVQTPDSLFEPLYNLTFIYEKTNKLAKAQKYYEEALRIQENWKGVNGRDIIKHRAIVLNRISTIVYKMGNVAEAIKLNRQASAIARNLATIDGAPDVFQPILLESSYLLEKHLGDSSKKSSQNDLTSFLYKPNETTLRSCCVSFLRTKTFALTVPTDKQIKRFEKEYKRWLKRQSKKIQKKHPKTQLVVLTSLTNSYERSILNVAAQNWERLPNVEVVVVLPMSKEAFNQIYNYPNFADDLRQATKVITLPLTKTTRQPSSSTNLERDVDVSNSETQRQIALQLDYLKYYMFQQSLDFLHWNGKKIKLASPKIKDKYCKETLNEQDV